MVAEELGVTRVANFLQVINLRKYDIFLSKQFRETSVSDELLEFMSDIMWKDRYEMYFSDVFTFRIPKSASQPPELDTDQSCAGRVDGMKKWIDNNSSITGQNQPKLFRQKVHCLVQLLMQNV